MKMKKWFIVAVALLCMMSFSQAAFAADMTPKVIGIGDTMANAIPLSLCNSGCTSSGMVLQSSTDVDWYKWENTTGTNKFVQILMGSPSTSNYALGYQIKYPNGALSTKVYAADAGIGGVSILSYIYVPSGATLYFEVSVRSNVNPTQIYQIMLSDLT